MIDQKTKDTRCKLNSGDIRQYDLCADRQDAYDPDLFECIGRGVIKSVNGVRQLGIEERWFFVRRQQQPPGAGSE